jgi:hypothetical protein
MPKVITQDGKTRHFAYSKAGVEAAKAYAKSNGGRVDMRDAMKMKMAKAKKKDA